MTSGPKQLLFDGFPSLAEQGKTNVKVFTAYIVEMENRNYKTSNRFETSLQIHFSSIFLTNSKKSTQTAAISR